jgi:single-strand DNA-binding protein
MNNINSVMLEGNMVRDPSLKSTPNGTPVCTFSLAINRYFKQESEKEPEVSFFDVETWSQVAENCYNQGHKGLGVRIMGRLKQNRWSDTNGKNHSRVCIVAEKVEFKPGKNEYSSKPNKGTSPETPRGFSRESPKYQEEYVPAF